MNETRCQFHQHFRRAFFVRKFVQSQNVTRKKAFVCKICAYNVDEIAKFTDLSLPLHSRVFSMITYDSLQGRWKKLN